MGFADDDEVMEDDEYYDDDDDIDDDDEEVGFDSRSAINPFASGSSGLPGRNRAGGTSPFSGSGSGGSGSSLRDNLASRLGVTPTDNPPARDPKDIAADRSRFFGSTGAGGGSGSGDRTASSGGGGSPFSNRPGGGDRPSSPTGGARFGGGSGSGDRTASSGGGSSPFSNRPGGGDRPSSPTGGGSSTRPPTPPGGTRFGGGSGNRPSSPTKGEDKSESSGSPFSSRFSGGGDRPSSPTGGGSSPFSNRPGGSTPSPTSKPADKKDAEAAEKPSGGLRLPFGGKKDGDDKKSKAQEESRSGGLRLPFGGKKDGDDKKSKAQEESRSGGSRLPFGGKKDGDDKKSKAQEESRSGGLRLPFGGKKDGDDHKAKASGGGKSGGLTSFLPFGKKPDDSSASKKPGAAKPEAAGGGRGLFGRFGGAGRKPEAETGGRSGPAAKASTGAKPSPFGQAKASGEAPTKKPDGERRGLLGSMATRLPFMGGAKAEKKQPQSKTRASKVPHTREDAGLSLDAKLDLLGVGLITGSIVLFASAISNEQGAITGAINGFFTELLGWGLLGVPIAMFLVGMWLILRHFGDDAPEVDPVRVAGWIVLYIGLLMVFMFIETFNPIYQYASQETFYLFVQNSVAEGRGGGLLGAELYTFVLTSFGEISAVFFMLGWLVVGLMLATRTSAAEMAIFVISIWRSFQISMQHRAQKQRALRLEREQQRQLEAAHKAEQQRFSVQKPAAAELGMGAAAALPAPTPQEEHPLPIEERAIPIRMGGQMITSPVEQPAVQLQAGAQPAMPPKSPAPEERASGGGGFFGGLGSRLRLPGGKPAEKKSEEKPAESAGGGVAANAAAVAAASVGSVLGRHSTPVEEGTEQPRPKPPVPDLPAQAPSQPATAFGAQSTTHQPTAAPGERPGFAPRSPSGMPASPVTPSGTSQTTVPGGSLSARLGARPFSPASPTEGETEKMDERSVTPPAARSPFASPDIAPKPMEMDDEDETDEEDEVLSRLAPAQPKGLGPAPRPAPRSTFASRFAHPQPDKAEDEDDALDNVRTSRVDDLDDEDIDEDDKTRDKSATAGTLTDRLNRLNAIRSGQSAGPVSPVPDARAALDKDADDLDEDFEDDEDEDVSPEDMVARMSAVRSADPFSNAPPLKKPEADPNRPYSPFRKPEGTPSGTETVGERLKPSPTPAGIQTGTTPAPRPAFTLPTAHAATPPRQPETPAPEPAKPAALQATPPVGEGLRPSPTSPTAATQPADKPPIQQPASQLPARPQRQWRLPDLRSVLSSGSEQEFDREGLVKRARIIEETLQSFGAPGRVVEINTGPVITQFGVEPDYLNVRGGKKVRVKVGAIAQLDKDLQLALGAKSIRVEAPVPGKGFVGIEVPNEEASLVSLRDVMESQQFRKINSPLAIALGQSVDGSPVSADLTTMPHLLIAGTTGSGKSVCVNSIIASLLLRNTPEDVKFIMVDPKRVELTGYNGVPHLIAPVVVELERIVGVLKWVTREMDERYKRFSNAGARNITDYNQHLKPGMEKMPYIVVIIDELADLMMLAPEETERVITRIAALARATGIHLVIATQRPSVDIITGLIKANFPARIAFAVASSVDSRVILDQPGAERLLGRGDMLYMSPDSPAPTRLQGVFVSDMEINNIHRFWRAQRPSDAEQRPITALVMDGSPAPESRSVIPRGERFVMTPPASTSPQRAFWDSDAAPASPAAKPSNGDSEHDDGHEDELYAEAVEMVRRLNKASVSLLQRRLRIGYTRAARLIDLMEAEGIVGPPTEGSKPREVLPPKR